MIINDLTSYRKSRGLTQEQLASMAGVSRMTVNKIEKQGGDPQFSTLMTLARAMDLELMAVPKSMRPALDSFVRSGGRMLGQSPGASAPPSVVDRILKRVP
jgi:transcriptional regulator with XRE-family HTH domain